MGRLTPTTALLIETDIDEDAFAKRGKIVRYAVPSRFRYITDSFARLHSELREKLSHPYYFYSYDKPEPAIYVLYPPDFHPVPLKLEFMNDIELKRSSLSIKEISEFHILIKLLQAAYFQSRHKAVASRGKYYVVAKHYREGNYLVCLQLDIRGAYRNQEGVDEQEFKVTDSATRFRRWERDKLGKIPRNEAFFGMPPPKGGQSFLRPLKLSELEQWEGDIYVHSPKRNSRTGLPFHSVYQPRQSRGYLLHTFIRKFLNHLQGYGVRARSKHREFNEFYPSPTERRLPVGDLNTVWLLDNRLNQETIPLALYEQALNDTFASELGLQFKAIAPNQISPERSLLILQDTQRDDFEEDGLLADEADPYQQLYRNSAFSGVPKQSINVNPHKVAEEVEDYLSYDLVPLSKTEWNRRFRVSLDELYLKTLILRPQAVTGRLPFLEEPAGDMLGSSLITLDQYAFVRKKTVAKTNYWTLLYIENGELRFADLRNPVEREQLYALMERLELDWDADVIGPLLRKRHKEKEEELRSYDFILGPGQVIEIEDTKEDVLYDYDTIMQRQEELREPFPIDDLKLARHYDQLKRKAYPSRKELGRQQLSLLDEAPVQHAEARAFLARLEQYDRLLDEVGRHQRSLSYKELTSEPLVERIAEIFNLRRATGKIHRGNLIVLYQKLGMFLSEKSKEVHLYEGVWYDDELCYMVGDNQSLEQQQPVSHLLRRFDVYRGRDKFNVKQWLDTLTVPFVRPERYTVFPYFFHLLDLYVESHLRFGEELPADDPAQTD